MQIGSGGLKIWTVSRSDPVSVFRSRCQLIVDDERKHNEKCFG